MGTQSIRFGSTLTFDSDTEKDIIKVMEHLNATHATGKFISNLIRVALDNPEILDRTSHHIEKGAVLKKIEELNLSCNRYKFFNDINKEIEAMKKKVDKVYELSLKNYTLAQMGKHLGLEDKANNTLLAGFVLEKQLKELQDTLGITLGMSAFESGKLVETHKKADDILEYIIETYDSLVNELKSKFEVQTVQVPITQEVQVPMIQPVQNIHTDDVDTAVNNVEDKKESIEVDEKNKIETTEESDDNKEIDFGNADMDALASFFNM